jgi:polysaccharide pyruvyl transferase WcaK-like protein
VTAAYNPHEVKAIIGRCGFFIGARMHSCIAALSQEIPTVGMAYSRKFAGVFESVGAGETVVDLRAMSNAEILSAVAAHYAGSADLRRELHARIEATRALLRETFEELSPGVGAGAGGAASPARDAAAVPPRGAAQPAAERAP